MAPVIAVDRKAASPLHRQVYDGYRTAILGGNLRAGQRVPSTRALALELGISRIPVLEAYDQLLAEGYFESQTGAGTFVSTSLPDQSPHNGHRANRVNLVLSGPREVSRRSMRVPLFENVSWLRGWGPFNQSQLAFEHFPFQIWSSLVTRSSKNLRTNDLHYGDALGSEPLRKAIAIYLRTARAVRCEPEQIMIVGGSQQALEISCRVLLDPGNSVWMEEPGYRLTRNILSAANCRIVPVPVDKEGLNVAAGIKKFRKARAAFVTPSHQYPLGVTMTISRRMQLLDWAQSVGGWIVEDDYDSEFRYESMPIASLQGLDHYSRVIYIGTFSKVVFPSLRIGYIVIPLDLVERFFAVRHLMDLGSSRLYQTVLAAFMNEGHFARHIRRMRLVYGQRRSALVEGIRREFGDRMEILGAEAGLHLVATLPKGMRDREIARIAGSQNLWLWPLSPSYLGQNPRHGFILGFGSTPVPDMPDAVRRMRDIIASVKDSPL